MTTTDIAKLIPAEYRSEILLTNAVGQAQAVQGNASMTYLFEIWKEYVEQSEELNLECTLCLARVLKNYQELLPVFIQLEKEKRLLESV